MNEQQLAYFRELLQKSLKLIQAQQYEEARAHFQRGVQMNANNKLIWNNLGSVLHRLGKPFKAIEAFTDCKKDHAAQSSKILEALLSTSMTNSKKPDLMPATRAWVWLRQKY